MPRFDFQLGLKKRWRPAWVFQININQQHFLSQFFNFTVPGKPPGNLSVDVIGTTSVSIGWELLSLSYTPIPTTALRIFYKLEGNTTSLNIVDTNFTTGYFLLDNLEKFSWYTVWVRSVTSRGVGPETHRFRLRTLEEGM